MKKLSRLLFITFYLFALSLSCIEREKNNVDFPEETFAFDSLRLPLNIQFESFEVIFSFIEQNIEHEYSNNLVFEDWLISVVPILIRKSHASNTNQLIWLLKHLRIQKYDQVSPFLANAILSSEVFKDQPDLVTASALHMANFHGGLNNFDSLFHYLRLVEEIGDPIIQNDTWYASFYYARKASLKVLQGHFFEAVMYYNKQLSLIEKDDSTQLFLVYHDLASMYLKMDFVDKAKVYADKALQIAISQALVSVNLNTFGLIYSKSKDFTTSDSIFKVAADFAVYAGDASTLAQTYANHGNLRRKEQRFDEALRYIDMSDSICLEINLHYGLLVNQVNRANVYLDKGDFGKANLITQNIDKQVFNNESPSMQIGYHDLRHQIFDAMGDSVSANRHYRIYRKLKDDYTGDLPRSVISEWELLNERELYTKQLMSMELSFERESKNKYFIAFISLLILFLGAIYFFIKHRRDIIEREKLLLKQQRLSHDLEMKSKELLANSISHIHTQNVKNDIASKLEALLDKLSSKDQQRFAPLVRSLMKHSPAKFSKDFEIRFLGVYDDFYQRLLDLAPDLSPTELKVCAFIKLNFTTKDIALISNRSLRTIENSRSLIRTKLQLNANENLQNFILSI
jgi:tetratricopeptide (TPR) repeat protein